MAGGFRRRSSSYGGQVGGQVAIERRETNGVKPAVVFRFPEDWAPWIAHVRMRERWPVLSFRLFPSYLHTV
jgi:hypothetical protein